jgi:hypothetical protein
LEEFRVGPRRHLPYPLGSLCNKATSSRRISITKWWGTQRISHLSWKRLAWKPPFQLNFQASPGFRCSEMNVWGTRRHSGDFRSAYCSAYGSYENPLCLDSSKARLVSAQHFNLGGIRIYIDWWKSYDWVWGSNAFATSNELCQGQWVPCFLSVKAMLITAPDLLFSAYLSPERQPYSKQI